MNKTFIIAEAGVNHNGNFKIAKKMINEAKKFKADAIKFQIFNSFEIATKKANLANYQKDLKKKKKNQLEMLQSLSLKKNEYIKLKNHCLKKKIEFLCSPFDENSLKFLIKIGCKNIKIASGEITNIPLLRLAGKLAKKVIISTGMANLKEIKFAYNVLIKAGLNYRNIVILHCTSVYPASLDKLNLNFINILKRSFKSNIGYSDHTLDKQVPSVAVTLGAKIIEKHFTLNRSMNGPDHKASITPKEFNEVILNIRKTEIILGDGKKKISQTEKKIKRLVRKSIVAKKIIEKGDIFSISNITTKRPNDGLSPIFWDKIIGKKSKKFFKINEKIKI
jgi:N,N'-diacetyllegionaminate synthase